MQYQTGPRVIRRQDRTLIGETLNFSIILSILGWGSCKQKHNSGKTITNIKMRLASQIELNRKDHLRNKTRQTSHEEKNKEKHLERFLNAIHSSITTKVGPLSLNQGN